jgi:hypothetical protein
MSPDLYDFGVAMLFLGCGLVVYWIFCRCTPNHPCKSHAIRITTSPADPIEIVYRLRLHPHEREQILAAYDACFPAHRRAEMKLEAFVEVVRNSRLGGPVIVFSTQLRIVNAFALCNGLPWLHDMLMDQVMQHQREREDLLA